MSSKRWLLAIVSFAVTIGASVYIVYTTWPQQRNPAILPLWAHTTAVAIVALEVLARALKFKLSALCLRIPLSINTCLRVCLGGDFGAAITPGRSGAEPARFLVLSEAGVPPARNLLLLFLELLLEMSSLAVVVIGLGIYFRQEAGAALGGVLGVVGAYSAVVLGIGALGVVLSRGDTSGPPPAWAVTLRLTGRRWRTVQRALKRIRSSVIEVRGARFGFLGLAWIASVAHIMLRTMILPLLVYALGVVAPLAPLVLWPLALVYGAVVAPVPGGGGLIEITFKHFLGDSIPAPIFGATLVWWRFYTFYLYVILGAFAAGRTVMRALREEQDEGVEEEGGGKREEGKEARPRSASSALR